ncbi:hypothetical protein, partial [Leifsonia sp. RAF41]|uniref:hypothetical protein n=1 Tax=Leifsonia sp. RAF41 TaxID=3233056 RepID=UPI003F9A6313
DGRPGDRSTGGYRGGDRDGSRGRSSGERSQGGYRGGERNNAGSGYSTGRSQGGYRGGDRNDSRDGRTGDRQQGGYRGGDRQNSRDGRPGERSQGGYRGAESRGQADGPRRNGAQRPGHDDKLWTREGRPARGDRDARDEGRRYDEDAERSRELQSIRPRHDDPIIPDEIQARDLPGEARVELKTLSKDNADWVAKHLVMAGRLIESDPELAHQHAVSASRRAGRVAVVRETLAITAYAIGDFALALRELRTYRRISGSNDQLPLMVDSERGVGRPDRALELGRSVDRGSLPVDVQVSLAIAMSGARLDLNQPEAALAELEIPQLDPDRAFSYSADLFHAYAEVLEELGRDDQATQWRDRAARAEAAFDQDLADDELETMDIIEEDLPAQSDHEPEAELEQEAELEPEAPETEPEAELEPETESDPEPHDGEDKPDDGAVSTEQ